MENASKALLIAASVLIAILLIAMGVKVVTSSQGTINATESTMITTEVAMFNNKFMQYIGDNRSKGEALSFLNMVVANNNNNSRKVTVEYRGHPRNSSIIGIINHITSSDSSIKFNIYIPAGSAGIQGIDDEGYIETIWIIESPI